MFDMEKNMKERFWGKEVGVDWPVSNVDSWDGYMRGLF